MADASGTPSPNFSIPTLNVSVDPPSGNGENTIVSSIDTLLAKGFVIMSAKGDIVYSSAANVAARLPIGATGNVLTVAGGVPTWAPSASAGVPVTTLPGSPVDGQQAILTDNTATPTYAWLLQWSATASKWLFIGGTPAYAQVAAGEGLTGSSYAALTTAGPSFTVPRAGDYYVSVGSQQSGVAISASFHSFDIGGTGAVDANSCGQASSGSSGTNNTNASVTMTSKVTGLAASTALVSKYKSDGTHSTTFTRRWMSVLPIAVT